MSSQVQPGVGCFLSLSIDSQDILPSLQIPCWLNSVQGTLLLKVFDPVQIVMYPAERGRK